MKTLLFAGHPGHELLAYKFLTEYRPDVVFLTTGSGNKDNPRINGSIELVESLGLRVLQPFKPFHDREIYDLILDGDLAAFDEVKSAIKNFVISHQIDRIVGDALEGFNPSHDLCRYLINACVLECGDDHLIENYDFLQDELFRNKGAKASGRDILLKLTDKEMEAKLASCYKYSELKFEVDRFFEAYGTDFFKLEYFRVVNQPEVIDGWEGKKPFYETHGLKRVEEGVYDSALLFEEHMRPLAEHLLRL